MRYKLITLLLTILCIAQSQAQYYYNAPNASAYNPINNKYLITNQGSGEVFQIDRAGNKTLFAKNLKSPRNIAMHKLPIGWSVLVLDSNRMVIFDTTGNQLGTETIAGIQQIQDCAYDSIAKILYTTDRVRGCIYKTTFATNSPYAPHTTVWVSNIAKPSAILLQKSKNRLLLVQDTTNSNLIAVSLLDSSVQTLRSLNIKQAMGLAEDAQGNLYIASVGDKYIYQLNKYYSGNPKILLSEPKPGDITIVSERNEWVYTCIICGKVFVADIHLFGPDSEIVGCASDSVTTYKNPFIKNIGTFEKGNEFVLELSNETGDFGKGYELNRVSDTLLPLEIKGVLPANLAAGMGYRLRWSSTKPKINGYLQMTQILEAPKLSLSKNGSQLYDCGGIGLRIKAQDSNTLTDYTWRVNETVIPDSTLYLTVKGTNSLNTRVKLFAKQTETGCTANDSIDVVFAANPNVPANWNDIETCWGDVVSLGDTLALEKHTFSWTSRNPDFQSDKKRHQITSKQTDTFLCKVTTPFGCTAVVSQILRVNPYDTVRWIVQSDTLLSVKSRLNGGLAWFKNGQLLTNQTSTSIVAPDSGWYKVCTQMEYCTFCTESFRVHPKQVANNRELNAKKTVKIYPNPASDLLNLDVPENTSWRIKTVLGKQLLLGSGNVIDVSRLSQGNYLITIGQNSQLFTVVK